MVLLAIEETNKAIAIYSEMQKGERVLQDQVVGMNHL
jgi:hypothetical protein